MRPRVAQNASLDDSAEALLGSAVKQMALSPRAYHRVMKLARTIADLNGAANCGHDRDRRSPALPARIRGELASGSSNALPR